MMQLLPQLPQGLPLLLPSKLVRIKILVLLLELVLMLP